MKFLDAVLTCTPGAEAKAGVYELLPDLHFSQGFQALNMGGSEKNDTVVADLTYGDDSLQPLWKLAQWETRYDFRDPAQTVFSCLSPGVYCYDSRDKVLTVNTNEGLLSMDLRASEVYDAPRTDGQGWPHLLIEGTTVDSAAPFASQLKNAKHLRLTFSQRLTDFQDHMGPSADSSLHAGSFYIYLYIKGVNPKGETEMMWFGLTLFDNRFQFDTEQGSQDTGKDDASGWFIYQIPICAFRDAEVNVSNDWTDVDIDVLPFVKRALILAQQRGYMQGITMDTVYIDGMNMGWEMPGTYDGRMEIKNLSLRSYVDTDYTLPNGVANFLIWEMEDRETIPVDEKCTLVLPRLQNRPGDILTVRCDRQGNAYILRAWWNGEETTDNFEQPVSSGDIKIVKPGLFQIGE